MGDAWQRGGRHPIAAASQLWQLLLCNYLTTYAATAETRDTWLFILSNGIMGKVRGLPPSCLPVGQWKDNTNKKRAH